MQRVALTGGIATGKSYVRMAFERLGVPTVDADTLARQAVAAGSQGLQAVIRRFGPAVVDAAGALDRRTLADVVFRDEAARRDLEAIIHPIVRQQTDAWFAALDPSHAFAIADIPLLFEAGRERDFDRVVATLCEPATQLARMVNRGLTDEEVRLRLAAQLPAQEKARRADFVVRTDGTFEETDRQVERIAEALGRT